MSYSFGNVHGPVQTGGGTQYYAGRDQYAAGHDLYTAGRDQVVRAPGTERALAEVASLRGQLAELRLTAAERRRAERDLTAVEGGLRGPAPDKVAIGDHLSLFAAGLRQAGALAAAGTSLLTSIQAIAHWLGPLGAAVLALL